MLSHKEDGHNQGTTSAAVGGRASFIDVGKGDCILLQAGGSAALIDTGYENTSERVLSCLRSGGVERLEFVIITHYDRDHIGGVRAIGAALEVGMVYLPAYEGADKRYRSLMSAIADRGLATRRVAETLSLKLGDALLTVYPSGVEYIPDAKGDEGNDNDLSLVTSLTCGGGTFLFAGDLEEDGIEDYLRAGRGRFDVLKVPCHGKKCPCTDELFDEVRPEIAVITDSPDDPADKKTLKLLAEVGANVYRTSMDGTIVVESDGAGGYAVSCHGGLGSGLGNGSETARYNQK